MAGLFGMVLTPESRDLPHGHAFFRGVPSNEFDIIPYKDPSQYQVRHPSLSDPLRRGCSEYQLVHEYINRSSAPSHGARLAIRCLQRVEDPPTRSRNFAGDQRIMLWHGTKSANVRSILSDGFRIDMASAAGMYGSGVYFADSVTKSFNYCGSRIGVLFLCEVAVGDVHPMTTAGRGLTAPPRGDSVLGVGNISSAFSREVDGVLWPVGALYHQHSGMALAFNEYIVYDASKVTLRYVVTVEDV